jgi:hypothetical protein
MPSTRSYNNSDPQRNLANAGEITVTQFGRACGAVRNGVFRRRCGSAGFLRTPAGIAFTLETLRAIRDAGALELRVTNTDTGVEYRTSLHNFMLRSTLIDRGYGEQRMLPLSDWLQAVVQLPLLGGAR